jgi:hypothetical protein
LSLPSITSHHNKEGDLVPTIDLPAQLARECSKERCISGAIDGGFQNTSQRFRNRASTLCTNGADQAIQVRGQNPLAQSSDPSETSQSSLPGSFETVSDATRIARPVRQVRASRDLEDIAIVEESEKRRQELPVLERWSRLLREQANGSSVDEALDFERRKRAAIQSRRELNKSRQEAGFRSTTDSSSNSPHTSRYLAARGALSSVVGSSEATTSSHGSQPPLGYNDSRAYFIRHQGLSQSSKPKIGRIQSSRLPLERIDEDLELHDLALGLSISLDIISGCFGQIREVDQYIQSGSSFDAFATSDLEDISKIWETRLVAIIQEKYKKKGSDEVPLISLDIYTAIKSQPDKIAAA